MFLGNPSSRIRQELWKKIEAGIDDGGAMMIWSRSSAQGYDYLSCGDLTRQLEDFEGLALVRIADKKKLDL